MLRAIEEANNLNVPKASEIFVYGDCKMTRQKISRRCHFAYSREEVEDRETSRCEYAAKSNNVEYAEVKPPHNDSGNRRFIHPDEGSN